MIPRGLTGAFADAIQRLGLVPGCHLRGLPTEALPLLVESLQKSRDATQIIACEDDETGLALRDNLLSAGFSAVVFCPSADSSQKAPSGFASPLESFRLDALARLGLGAHISVFVCSLSLLADGLPASSDLEQNLIRVRPGRISWPGLRIWLADNGYQNISLVTEPGTYALRGSVIDVFPANAADPIRLDFMGDELENIRSFDIHSQISSGKLSSAAVISLIIPESVNTDLLSYFPGRFQLLKYSGGDAWQYLSHTESDPTKSFDLGIEPFAGANLSAPLLVERWKLLQKENPDSQAFVVSDQLNLVRRPLQQLSAIPLTQESGFLASGFISAQLGIYLLTPAELFQRSALTWRPTRQAVSSLAKVRQHVESLEPGDFIVHVNHGIGRYLGLTQLAVGGTDQECLQIEYRGGDQVYVSTEKISLVFPYSVGDKPPALDSLQSGRWERVKRQTRRSAEEVVDQLAELYALRSLSPGVVHPVDDELQDEFEAAFPYDETSDQVRAISEIKADLERPLPMDRLLCGDVGFGKTEVALRAAFKVIRGGGQVAFLAPTTILADQHLISFRSRLEPFAVSVGLLSRFVTAKDQRQTIAAVSEGKIDLLVGTHRLLSKDVTFKNLSLLVIDEEHRFGVKHKERIKEITSSLDVLSLTATPIPRTLHFSLAGIRDISRLDSPPRERIPIITSIHFFNHDLIRKAVDQELARGGQVYFVHNEVKTILAVYRDLQELLPNVSLGLAHGQLPGRELENTMLAFAAGEFQILVCTSIIESGIDLPNVNTVIINDSHRLGLAQLYQIRGRVGRSNRQAYAYLLIRRRPKLTREATKRLKTIERFSALGSGYAIALRDLEIRGTGNIFGLEQSGHVAAVGLDLFTRIIQGVIRERALGAAEPNFDRVLREEITIRLFPGAGIPGTYLPDPHLRLNIYRRISALNNPAEIKSFTEEITDRFGAPPVEVVDLLRSQELRLLADSLGLHSVSLSGDGLVLLDFAEPDDPGVMLDGIRRALEAISAAYRFTTLRRGDLRVMIDSAGREPYDLAKETFLLLRQQS